MLTAQPVKVIVTHIKAGI